MKQISLRICILLCIFSLTIIPVLLINTFYVSTVVQNVREQNQTFYCDLVNQLAINIDYYYSQYAEDFSNSSMFPSFQKILSRPELSPIDEQIFLHYSETSMKLRENVLAKIPGDFFLIEFDRSNIMNNTPYNLIDFSEKMAVNIDVKKMETEPALAFVKNGVSNKAVLCEAEILKSSLPGKYQNRTFFFYPYRKDNEENLKYLMGVMCSENFFHNIYKDSSGIERGTVYLQDQFGKLLDVNHPSKNDSYEYDNILGKYHDDGVKSKNKMSFKEYQLLNTDPEILQSPQFLYQRENFDNENWNTPNYSVVLHKQQKFLSVFMRAPLSQIEISFFYPLILVYIPVVGIIVGNLILMALLLAVMILVIIKVTNRLMMPITLLINAQKEVESGNCDVKIDDEIFFGEFADIGRNFNEIVSKIANERSRVDVFLKEQQQHIFENSKKLEAAAKSLENERLRMKEKLLEIYPKKTAEKIFLQEQTEPEVYKNVSILFFDINFSGTISGSASSELLLKLNEIFNQFDEIMNRYGCCKIRTMGQTYLAVCGLPLEDSWHIQHITSAAIECVELIERKSADYGNQIKFRAGICCGSVTAGVIGIKKCTYDILGEAVVNAYNFVELTPLGKLSVSDEVYNCLQKSGSWEFKRLKEVIFKNGKIEEMYILCGEKS